MIGRPSARANEADPLKAEGARLAGAHHADSDTEPHPFKRLCYESTHAIGYLDAVRRRNIPYPAQKLRLYADENVPLPLVDELRSEARWRRKVSIQTAAEAGNANQDDAFQFRFCRTHGLILVTLDADFWDDQAFPFGEQMPGIIIIDARSQDDIASSLDAILSFICGMPFPIGFAGDSKFKVSNEGAVMRGRDARNEGDQDHALDPGHDR
jgi:predicted nuclease of predicted toxin-antitoxin system